MDYSATHIHMCFSHKKSLYIQTLLFILVKNSHNSKSFGTVISLIKIQHMFVCMFLEMIEISFLSSGIPYFANYTFLLLIIECSKDRQRRLCLCLTLNKHYVYCISLVISTSVLWFQNGVKSFFKLIIPDIVNHIVVIMIS